ncbi:hypothetical protein UVI_02008750 [Ustilaginoidea virens]|nr:hypothetical protein UVI_02008750 [Ustilaginoidea virens]
MTVLDREHDKPVDITKWFSFFAFDIMEDLAFNQNSNLVRDGREKFIFKTMRQDSMGIALLSHLLWLLPLLKRTPILNRNYLQFWKWIQDKIDERTNNQPDQPDIFSWILADFEKGPKTRRDRWNLHGDAQLIVVAGSDTTSTTLTHLFFELAGHAELLKNLQREFDALPDLSNESLSTVVLLEAVIQETLRLHPAVPSGTQRLTPPEGLQIGDHHVPGNTIVQVPSYTIFRDARFFDEPNEFIPERWTTRPELVRDSSVFIPFNIGPYSCVGKRLAMLELRRTTAEILSRYDVRMAPGQTKEAFLEEKKDTFTVILPPLNLIFTPRS